MPLRVAIGVVAGVRGGPATYALELVRALDGLVGDESGHLPEDQEQEQEQEQELELYALTDCPELFEGLRRTTPIEVRLGSAYRQPWWDNVAVPSVLRRLRPDVFHGTKHALPLCGIPAGCATVVTIHDLAVYAEPETFSRLQRWQLYLHLRHAAHRATRVVCDSEHAASDVASRLGVPRSRLEVVPLGVSSRFVPPATPADRVSDRAKLGIGDDSLVVFVGTLQPRKRIDVLVEAILGLRRNGLAVSLLIAGRRRPGFSASWLDAPPSGVRVLGELSDEEIVRLYGAADVMVSPSTYEGFGLTFAEAMACGCPVVGVRATSVPEVVGEGGLLVERSSSELVAAAIESLLGDPAFLAKTAALALEQAGQLSWTRAAKAMARIYRQVHRKS